MTRLGVTFKEIVDPRARRGRRHDWGAMLGLLVQGMAVGKRVLRQVEALGEDLVREGTGPGGLLRMQAAGIEPWEGVKGLVPALRPLRVA
jgi:hypothetical protein